MEIIKSAHHIISIIFLVNSILLSGFYLINKDKSNKAIAEMTKFEWFLSSLLFFLGMILMLLFPFWFQVGGFYVKMAIAMFTIGASHYFYKQYEIATKENQFPKLLSQLRIFIPLLIFATYYSGKLIFNN